MKIARSFLQGIAAMALMWGFQGQAADVSVYGIEKTSIFTQAGPGALAPASPNSRGFTAFAAPSPEGVIEFVMLTTPGGSARALVEDQFDWRFSEEFSNEATLSAAFGAGGYNFTFLTENDGPSFSTLAMAAPAYAAAPRIANFDAAQEIDPAGSFILTWDAVAGATAQDVIQVVVQDAFGFRVADSGGVGVTGALNGTATSYVIPSGSLEEGSMYSASVKFIHVTGTDESGYPGALGVAAVASETRLSMMTTGEGGGPGDTTPPILIMSNPSNNATGVSLLAPVSFTFSEPMASSQSVTWSANVTPGGVNCVWSADQRTLVCSPAPAWPAQAAVTWSLNTTVFGDTSGNALLGFNNTGLFVTGSGTNDPCGPGENDGMGTYGLTKSLSYVQTSANPPVPNAESPANFSAVFNAPPAFPTTNVSLTLPNGSVTNLTAIPFLPGQLFHFAEFDSEAGLNGAYPGGNYRFTATASGGQQAAAQLALAASAPPTPQVSNFDAAQAINPAANFELRWNAFAGAGAEDGIYFEISDENGVVFSAPDPCVPRELANTAASITIPAGTLQAGQTYEASLLFSRGGTRDTNSIPGAAGYAMMSKRTEFSLKAAGGGGVDPAPARLLSPLVLSNGVAQVQFTGTINARYRVEATTDLKVWTAVSTNQSATGAILFEDAQAGAFPQRFYRAVGLRQ